MIGSHNDSTNPSQPHGVVVMSSGEELVELEDGFRRSADLLSGF